ncbi:SUMF1/EgtB/PvdO family nonheme iron enzyme [Luteolibacter pohnpeiensis]|uniref:SUMF1/EgtB/PvdO family nonheme iron enzyme n=1 Tax=Luteolibacter pohnpeiensis TaxID=454153 RepID=A0A934SCZ1_9BACT|nr:SUMF1/EgtB/PvdO family nonheme iron enzyme [Luteolibacter pohnpeiensis]MBK1882978.1 SUMF1/EgtB/PvdO family nonheme iron enzyme [Luteolibacter pohnpeiensis]
MMPNKHRPDPSIPDHEILRKIGGGAYGEVWLGRGVTGALRAIKVVWREDFEDERGFEREFEGILKFEPISRDHPGLVNILHVGRSPDGVSFYYYVMELGDDVRTGQDINPIEYEPRTLRADAKQAVSPQLETSVCIDVGLRLAQALNHLHELGLAHRDVKPSNVIFVNGKAKLADIGLVAARDQRTFVGTEGFVPPEGPGSAQADIYSLGKVLYEIATGKDRLDFPELPENLPSGPEQKRWLELNRIICEICEPRLSRRTISTASETVDALRRLQKGKKRRRRGVGRAAWVVSLILLCFSVWAGSKLFVTEHPWKEEVVPVVMRKIKVNSFPQGAEVFENGELLGTTQLELREKPVGETITLTFKLKGYRDAVLTQRVEKSDVDDVPQVFFKELERYAPPETGEMWTDHLGLNYPPVGDRHEGAGYVQDGPWQQYVGVTGIPGDPPLSMDFSENGKSVRIVLVKEKEAFAFCDWWRNGAMEQGYLTKDFEVIPVFPAAAEVPGLPENAVKEKLTPFKIVVQPIRYGTLKLVSEPPGAEVYVNKIPVGTATSPVFVPRVKPGPVEVWFILEGYTPDVKNIELKRNETLEVTGKLKPNQGVVFGRDWENGIGMKFVPVGPDLMVSAWETRVRDFQLYLKETGTMPPKSPDFPQGPDHPVVNVSRPDAVKFCDWLTHREQQHERIATFHQYRLPTDFEWSKMAGIEEEPGVEPGARDNVKTRTYPWGGGWPLTSKVGNFADISAAMAPGMSSDRTIPGYDDGFPYTAPVGSFPPNPYGLYDISGNAEEWVSDDYSKVKGPITLGVLRGGGWNTYQRENLLSGARNVVPYDFHDNIYGFRVVLAKIPQNRDNPLGYPDYSEKGSH